MTSLYNWATANRPSINSRKTYFMAFTNKITIPSIKMNNNKLAEISKGKFLGLIIDNTLKFDSHIDFI